MYIAEALLLRKQLIAKVAQLEPIKQMGDTGLFEHKITRVQVTENVDEVKMTVPKVELKDVTAQYDKYASALRKLDAAIQQANWTSMLSTFADSDNPFLE